MGIARDVLLWGSQNRWLENQFRQRWFAKKAVSRFMPGEAIESALAASEALKAENITTLVTYLGENVSAMDEAKAATKHYIDVLNKIQPLPIDTQVSVKLTQLGLDLDVAATARNLETITEHASNVGNTVWVDMEASNYVDATIEAFRTVRTKYENVGLCLQSYLHRTPKDLEDLLSIGAAIRLVKGAYQEPASVALPHKKDVDAAFLSLGTRLAENPPTGSGIKHGIATHDINIIDKMNRMGSEGRWGLDAYEVLMLYGIRKVNQVRLAATGVPMRVLISYGEAWFAWYMRRLAERPANIGFVLRSMFYR